MSNDTIITFRPAKIRERIESLEKEIKYLHSLLDAADGLIQFAEEPEPAKKTARIGRPSTSGANYSDRLRAYVESHSGPFTTISLKEAVGANGKDWGFSNAVRKLVEDKVLREDIKAVGMRPGHYSKGDSAK